MSELRARLDGEMTKSLQMSTADPLNTSEHKVILREIMEGITPSIIFEQNTYSGEK